MAYRHTSRNGVTYYLNSAVVKLKGGHKQVIYFFSKTDRDTGMDDIPQGFEVVENPTSGLPVLRRVAQER